MVKEGLTHESCPRGAWSIDFQFQARKAAKERKIDTRALTWLRKERKGVLRRRTAENRVSEGKKTWVQHGSGPYLPNHVLEKIEKKGKRVKWGTTSGKQQEMAGEEEN